MTRPWITTGREVLRELRHEWREDRVSGLAAEIAFFSLLSLFPGLLAFSAALSSADALIGRELADRAESETVAFLERVLTSEADTTIGAVESLFEQSSGGVLTFGVVIALWSMSRAVGTTIRGLNIAYDVGEGRSWLGRRLAALALGLGTLVVGLVAISMMLLGPLLGGGAQLAEWFGVGGAFTTLWTWLRPPFTALIVIAWTAVLFHFGPFERTGWRWHLPGAVASAAWWGVATVGLRAYLAASGGANQVFGILGGGLTLVMWLYLMSMGLLVGAELNAIIADRAGAPRRRPRHDLGRSLGDVASRLLRRRRPEARRQRRTP